MSRRAILAALFLALPGAALSSEKFAIIAVGDPPSGPDGDLAEMAYQLRAACRDRVPNVLDPPAMRARLVGQSSGATESELDRAYGGALAVYQNGEFESALRTFRAIVDDLEALPDTDESYYQWKRAVLQLAVAANAAKDQREVEVALGKLARVEPTLLPDPDQFSPGFRKRFDEVKAKVRLLPKHKLTVNAEGRQGIVYVNGKPMGLTPITLTLPSGTYRIGGAAGTLRVPSFRADLEQEDRTVVLDFATAESLRLSAGPGLALAPSVRANGIIRAGAWLGVDKLIVVTRSDEGQAQFLVGSIYDVLRGSLLREGSVRMVAGGVPSVNLSALSAFLLTGQASREVKELARDPKKPPPQVATAAPPPPDAKPEPKADPKLDPKPDAKLAATPAPPALAPAPLPKALEPAAPAPSPALAAAVSSKPPPSAGVVVPAARPNLDVRPVAAAPDPVKIVDAVPAAKSAPPASTSPRRSWRKPTSIGAGVLALGLAAVALQQNGAAAKAYSGAADQLTPGGAFKSVQAQSRYYSLTSDGNRSRQNAQLAAGGAAALAVSAVVLGWNVWRSHPADGAALKLEF